MTTTLTCVAKTPAECEKIAAALIQRGIAESDTATFDRGSLSDRPLAEALASWDIAGDAAQRYADAIEGGEALVVVRVSDQTRDTAKAILEGQAPSSAAAHSGDRGTEAGHLGADLTISNTGT